VSDYYDKVKSIGSDAFDLIQKPFEFADQVVDAISSIRSAFGGSSFGMLMSLYNQYFSSSDSGSSNKTPSRQQVVTNTNAVAGLVRQAAISQAAVAAVVTQTTEDVSNGGTKTTSSPTKYDSYEAAIAVRTELADRLDEESETTNSDLVYIAVNRVMMMFGRGVLRSVNDSNGRQQLQVELLKNELRDGVEHMQNYGFTSHPKGGDVAVAFIGGNREQGIALVVDDRRYRISLEPGEVAIYDDQGNKIELLREMIKVTAVAKVQIVAPDIEIIGNLKIQGNIDSTGTITNNGKRVDSTHTHASGGAGVPN